MLIRSQDKENLINMDNLTMINASDREITAYLVAEKDGYVRLGCYSSCKQAIKVLDMIQDAYNIIELVRCKQGIPRVSDKFYFQMPQDSEVEGYK